MALADRHTFQILTKRPERMRAYFADGWDGVFYRFEDTPEHRRIDHEGNSGNKEWSQEAADRVSHARQAMHGAPLPNVWLGVSVENQATADERIPLLLQTPAGVRFLSVEPLLGPVNLMGRGRYLAHVGEHGIGWVIIGGESGPGARPCDLAWIRSVVAQCKAAGVPVFVKQLGSLPIWDGCGLMANNTPGPTERVLMREKVTDSDGYRPVVDVEMLRLRLRDRKGGSMEEWPEDLRVREFPK